MPSTPEATRTPYIEKCENTMVVFRHAKTPDLLRSRRMYGRMAIDGAALIVLLADIELARREARELDRIQRSGQHEGRG